MENRPCIFPGNVIDEDIPGIGKKFKAAAMGRRGVTAWVECEGDICVGDSLTLHIPDQRHWKVSNVYSTEVQASIDEENSISKSAIDAKQGVQVPLPAVLGLLIVIFAIMITVAQ